MLGANPIDKVQMLTNILCPCGFCGHFALGIFSRTYFINVVFEIYVVSKTNVEKWENPNMSNLTHTHIKHRIIARSDFVSISMF